MNAETLTKMLPALIAGDENAWSRVYLELNDALVRCAMSLGLNQHDAEDCVMQAWANAIRAIKNGGEREVLCSSFFYTAVRNEAGNRSRKSSRNISLDGLDDHVREKIFSQLGTPAGLAATFDDFGETMKDVLETLDERERRLYHWRYGEGLSWAETGQKLGLTLSGAKSLELRMLAKLRRWFERFDT